jgi:K+-transporting ATPase KdpF subunit
VRPLAGVVPMILLLVLVLAIALAGYLVYALLVPERF